MLGVVWEIKLQTELEGTSWKADVCVDAILKAVGSLLNDLIRFKRLLLDWDGLKGARKGLMRHWRKEDQTGNFSNNPSKKRIPRQLSYWSLSLVSHFYLCPYSSVEQYNRFDLWLLRVLLGWLTWLGGKKGKGQEHSHYVFFQEFCGLRSYI